MFGLKQFGSITGLANLGITIPVLIGPILAGLIFDSTGEYNVIFAVTICLLAISIGCFLFVKNPVPNKQAESQDS